MALRSHISARIDAWQKPPPADALIGVFLDGRNFYAARARFS